VPAAPPNVWNSLPIDIRNTGCLSSIRNKLKTHCACVEMSYNINDCPVNKKFEGGHPGHLYTPLPILSESGCAEFTAYAKD